MGHSRLWPDWEADFLACFFVRLPAGVTREDAFQRAERSLASSRFKGLGRLVLRLPDRALAVLGLVIAAILVAIIR